MIEIILRQAQDEAELLRVLALTLSLSKGESCSWCFLNSLLGAKGGEEALPGPLVLDVPGELFAETVETVRPLCCILDQHRRERAEVFGQVALYLGQLNLGRQGRLVRSRNRRRLNDGFRAALRRRLRWGRGGCRWAR